MEDVYYNFHLEAFPIHYVKRQRGLGRGEGLIQPPGTI